VDNNLQEAQSGRLLANRSITKVRYPPILLTKARWRIW